VFSGPLVDKELHNRVCLLHVTNKKIKSTIPHEECWWGAHLPYLGLELKGG